MSKELAPQIPSELSLPEGFLEPVVNPDSEWRDLTDLEWRVLHTYLDTGYIWSEDQWKIATTYLIGQKENNLRDNIDPSELSVSRGMLDHPDRFLYARAQEIDMLAIIQLRTQTLNEDHGLQENAEENQHPTLEEVFESPVPEFSEISPWLSVEEGYGNGSRNRLATRGLKKYLKGQRTPGVFKRSISKIFPKVLKS